MLLFQMYTSVHFLITSKCTKFPTYQVRQKSVHAKRPCFDLEDLEYSVIKREFLMETDPFPAILCRILNILL